MKDRPESSYIGKEPCPKCGSRDNLARYDDGHAYCFGCEHRERPDGNHEITPRRAPRLADMLDGEIRALPSRGITEETCRKFGYRVGTLPNDTKVQVAPYYSPTGEIIAQKIRTANKEFSVRGDGKALPLFGQNLIPPSGRRLVITEGEIDAMSVSQAFNNKWPVVSVPGGAKAAAAAVARQIEAISGYSQIVFFFDGDEPGREAAVECAALLSPGQAFIASTPEGYKDANDLLRDKRPDLLCRAVYDARLYRPEGIVSLEEIEARVMAKPERGYPWYLPEVTKATHGRRPGELHGFGGGTGCGKTDLLTEQIAHDVMTLGLTTGVILLEQDVGETGRRLAGKMAGKRFHVDDGSWTEGDLRKSWDDLKSTNRLFLFDSWGAATWETVEPKIRYMVKSLGCQTIYLDHLTALAAAEDDEKRSLERIMAELAGLTKGLGIVTHYVSHLATPEGKSHEEGGRVMSRHFKGSRAIGYWSHGMWGLERNTQAEDPDERRRSTLRCLKDRNAGDATGQTWGLQYDLTTGRLQEEDRQLFPGEPSDGRSDF